MNNHDAFTNKLLNKSSITFFEMWDLFDKFAYFNNGVISPTISNLVLNNFQINFDDFMQMTHNQESASEQKYFYYFEDLFIFVKRDLERYNNSISFERFIDYCDKYELNRAQIKQLLKYIDFLNGKIISKKLKYKTSNIFYKSNKKHITYIDPNYNEKLQIRYEEVTAMEKAVLDQVFGKNRPNRKSEYIKEENSTIDNIDYNFDDEDDSKYRKVLTDKELKQIELAESQNIYKNPFEINEEFDLDVGYGEKIHINPKSKK